ncbi:Metallo-dependent phosphatase, partial [Rhizodiscina lignyota]
NTPLIEFVTNDWRNDLPLDSDSDSDSAFFARDSEDDWPPRLPQWVHNVKPPVIPRKVQRYLVLLIVLVTLSWAGFAFETAMRAADNDAAAFNPGATYGSNVEIELDGLIQLKSLAKNLLPHSGHHENRLIFIGDVHGCKTELLKLLGKVNFNRKHDHLIFTGDVVNKGPDSPGVVDVLRDLGASCVRGNHEDRVLLAWQDIHSHSSSPITITPEEDQLEKERYSKSEYRARKTARQLSKEQARWLQECPVILNVGHVEGMGEINVVHAGLVPGVRLQRQDPFQVMNMRSMDPETRVPSENRGAGMQWDKVWEHWQNKLPEKERSTVIYGHDSKRGLNIGQWVKGLDSGCVNGDRLTALVVNARGDQDIVSVKC